MRRLLATDLGIWPMVLGQGRASDMMLASQDCWAQLADYLLMYDQIVIPTGNLQILSVLRFMLGDDVLLELLETRTIVFARFEGWFGYIGMQGVVSYKFLSGPEKRHAAPNLATSHCLPLDQAIEVLFIATNPPSTPEIRQRYKSLLLEHTANLAATPILDAARLEAYRDIESSPYLQNMLSIRNGGRPLEDLKGSKADTVCVFNPHVRPGKETPPEIWAILNVVFENLLLGIGGETAVGEITGDKATLTVLQAKGQRLGFSPHGRAAFAQLQQVSGVPHLGMAFASKQLSARQIIDLRQSKHAQTFRDWLAAGSPSLTAQETLQRYLESVGKPSLMESIPVKLLRFASTTTWGALEPISGAVVAAADSFLLSKWFPGSSPRLFMRQAKVLAANSPVIRAPVQKGRDRNTQCSCGSSKKYKHCCGSIK